MLKYKLLQAGKQIYKYIQTYSNIFLDALASLESTVVGESVSGPQFRQGHNRAP